MRRLALTTKEVAMDFSKLPAFTFNSTAEAIAATCPITGEPEFESARRAVVASEYLGKDDGSQSRLATLPAETIAELVANIRRVIKATGEYVGYMPEEESEWEGEPEIWEEADIIASYGAQLGRFLTQLEQLSL